MSCGKYLLVLVLVCVGVWGNDNYSDLRRIDAIQLEQPCLQAGGMCTFDADCPSGSLSEQRGLCPKQRSQGIECCYGISVKETRCSMYGGTCVSLSQNNCKLR